MKEVHKLQKSISIEMPKIVETIKNTAATKENEAHDTRKNAKLQQQKQIAHLRKQKHKRLKEEA